MLECPTTVPFAQRCVGVAAGLVMGADCLVAGPLIFVLSRTADPARPTVIIGGDTGAVVIGLGILIIAGTCGPAGSIAVDSAALTIGSWLDLRRQPLSYADMANVAMQDIGRDEPRYRIEIRMKDDRRFRIDASRVNERGVNDRRASSGPHMLDLLFDRLVERVRANAREPARE